MWFWLLANADMVRYIIALADSPGIFDSISTISNDAVVPISRRLGHRTRTHSAESEIWSIFFYYLKLREFKSWQARVVHAPRSKNTMPPQRTDKAKEISSFSLIAENVCTVQLIATGTICGSRNFLTTALTRTHTPCPYTQYHSQFRTFTFRLYFHRIHSGCPHGHA